MAELSWLKDNIGKPLCVTLCVLALAACALRIEQPYAPYVAVCALAALLCVLMWFRETWSAVTSKVWFRALRRQLKDSKRVQVYLRTFVHPDDARGKHRNDVLDLMREFARLIVEHTEDFLLIAYRPADTKESDPIDWLANQVGSLGAGERGRELVERCVHIVRNQPTPNASTIYLIDGTHLVFNVLRSDGSRTEYYVVDLSRTIIPYCVSLGLHQVKKSARGT